MLRKIIKKTLPAMMLLLTSTTSAHSTEDIKIDIQSSIKMAFGSNEEWAIENNELSNAMSKHKEVQSSLYPKIDGNISWLSNWQYPDITQTKYTDDYYITSSVSFTQIISTFGRISSALKAADKKIAIAALQKDRLNKEIALNTKIKYYQALHARRALEIVQASYQRALENKHLLENRSERGRVSKGDNIKILADIAARVPPLNEAKSNLKTTDEILKSFLGLPYSAEVLLQENYPSYYEELDNDVFYQKLLAVNPVLKSLDAVIELQKHLIKGAKAEYKPKLAAFGSWQYKGGDTDPYVNTDHMHGYGTAGITLDIPIFAGGSRYQKVRQAMINKDNAALKLQKTYQDLRLELDKLLIDYNETAKALPAYSEAVNLAEQAFMMSQDLFAAGNFSATDLNDAEIRLTMQKLKYEGILLKLNTLKASIDYLTGSENYEY